MKDWFWNMLLDIQNLDIAKCGRLPPYSKIELRRISYQSDINRNPKVSEPIRSDNNREKKLSDNRFDPKSLKISKSEIPFDPIILTKIRDPSSDPIRWFWKKKWNPKSNPIWKFSEFAYPKTDLICKIIEKRNLASDLIRKLFLNFRFRIYPKLAEIVVYANLCAIWPLYPKGKILTDNKHSLCLSINDHLQNVDSSRPTISWIVRKQS